MSKADADRFYISNERLSVEIAKPGTYYKGSRFDWNGFITQITLDNEHKFCVPESLIDGVGTGGYGLCGEFGIHEPVGYDDVAPGGRFPKIGVGLINKPDNSEYFFFKPYEFTPFNTTITQSESTIEFTTHPAECNGYSVLYTKHISLDANCMTIEYALKNTGEKTVHTTEYCHNFMRIDDEKTGRGYTLSFPYSPVIGEMPVAMERKTDNALTWKDEDWGKEFYCTIEGAGAEQSHWWELYNSKTGVGVRETDDFKPIRVALWGQRHVISPEAFIEINVEPGMEQKWSRKYEFFK